MCGIMILLFCLNFSDFLSFQCAHLHLYDWCQLAIHSADHLPTHLGFHRADSAAAETINRGRRGDPESRDWGERSWRAGRKDASNQATQNRFVNTLSSDQSCCNAFWLPNSDWKAMSHLLIIRSAEVANCECWSLLLHSRCRSTKVASSAVQGKRIDQLTSSRDRFTPSFSYLVSWQLIFLPSVSDCACWEWWQLRWTEEGC